MSDRYDVLTRTGPGTPMGELMRQYWVPAALSYELKPDGTPMRLKLLGEKLVAFRDTAGRVGIFDHRCPHRCASLFFGRNEEAGLRCVYHGWKYDVDGNCLEMPNLPPQQDFHDKIKAKAYLVKERAGLIWVFMGDRAKAPPLPPFEPNLLAEERLEYRFVQRHCNWLQALEGDLDTSHLGFLHFGGARSASTTSTDTRDLIVNRAPEYEIADTDFGLSYGAYRPAEGGGTYWRIAHFLFPFWAMPPVSAMTVNVMARGWIPLDDEHCMFVGIADKDYRTVLTRNLPGGSLIDEFQPNGSDWLGRFRLTQSEDNDYRIDRAVQRGQSFTGIEGIHVQDQAITESMGAILDHSWENLAPSDIAVTRCRRMLLRTVEAFAKGIRPPGADAPDVFAGVRGGYYTTKDAGDWQKLYQREIARYPAKIEAKAY